MTDAALRPCGPLKNRKVVPILNPEVMVPYYAFCLKAELFRGIEAGIQILLAGGPNQLPSVGPGNALRRKGVRCKIKIGQQLAHKAGDDHKESAP